jgi:hypothetical protein
VRCPSLCQLMAIAKSLFASCIWGWVFFFYPSLAHSLPGPLHDEPVEYTRQIQPILAANCFACHGFDESSRQADLRLDVRESALESGAIDSKNPAESLILERILSDDPDLMMPPPNSRKTLSAEEKSLLKKWIEQGANYQAHWAFVPPLKTNLQAQLAQTESKNPIDAMVQKNLKLRGLQPSPPAEPAALFRRLHLDITGLLPTTEDLKQFLVDYQHDPVHAVSEWVDRLMDSSAWGEHRARYWLDAARYADTHGMHFDNYREMWPYRDWVIRSFNANQPFSQFITEQLAGDLFEGPSADQLIATGFQRCNITTNEGGTIEEENLALYAADRVQTFSWVFLGMTMNCAQCHDHKFDAITMQDYYGMAAFFRNTTQGGLDGNNKEGNSAIIHLPAEQDRPRWENLPKEISQAKAQLETYRSEAYQRFINSLSELNLSGINQQIPDAELSLYASFTDGSGEQIKSSRSTAIVGTGTIHWSQGGKLGPAAAINPQASFIIGEVGNWDFDQSFSYGAWVNPKDRNTTGAIIARMDTSNRFRGWDLLQGGARYMVHLIDSWSDNAIKVRTTNEVVSSDRWQHVFVTYDGSRRPEGIKIYVDGVLQPLATDINSLQAGATMRTDTPTRAGQRRADSHWSGSMQGLRLYDRELSQTDIERLFQGEELSSLLSLEQSERTPEKLNQSFQSLAPLVDPEFKQLSQDVRSLQTEYETIRARSPVTHVQKERTDAEPQTYVLMRGEYDKKGDVIKARTPSALHPFRDDWPRNRLGLAGWVVDPRNPLTARVTVNRFWQEIFGAGIVATTDDFGVMGSPPSNQELLDWLAVDFVENDWNVKRFFKQVFTSATYQQSAAFTPDGLEKDPHNVFLARGPRFRMDAEMIRDVALQTGGLLSTKMYGPGAKPYQPENIWNVVGLPEGNTRNYQQDKGENLYRRSLYSFWKRMAHPPNMEVLNAPSREVCVVRRERTNTPLQALVLLNDPIFVESARNLAQRVLLQLKSLEPSTISLTDPVTETTSRESAARSFRKTAFFEPMSDESKVNLGLNEIAQSLLNRSLTEQETRLLTAAHNDYFKHFQGHVDDADALLKVGESVFDASLDRAELATWTMICQQFLNLDETITK